MRWIILALSLGASITSIIHGVFMLFGSLSIGAGPQGLSAIWLASLPIVSAFSALIGGVVAFNRSRWGALFLAIATVLCAFAPRDIWIYGGIYLFTALLCFFLRPKREQRDLYYSAEEEDYEGDDAEEEEEYEPAPVRRRPSYPSRGESPASLPSSRARMTKTCPDCGENVPIESRFCPNCGKSLHIPARPERAREEEEPLPEALPLDIERPAAARKIEELNELEGVPPRIEEPGGLEEQRAEEEIGVRGRSEMDRLEMGGAEERDDTMQNFEGTQPHKVLVRPMREEVRLPKSPMNIDPDTSYQQFSQYARRRKKPGRRSRSIGRRILGVLLLVGAVGGALWFLLSLRKVPKGELPSLEPRETPPVATQVSQDVLVQPVQAAVPVETGLPAFTPSSQPTRGLITGDNVNMRADHSTSSAKRGTLRRNTRVDLLETWTGQSGNLSGPWYHIRTDNREGWVYGQYLQPIGEGLPSGYSNALISAFGDSRSALVEKLGQPAKSSASSADWSGLSATLRGDAVTRLRLSSSRHELQNGLRTGMAQTALFRILGYPSSVSQRQLQYNEGNRTGISVQLNRDGLIQTITVNQIQ